MRKKKAEEVEVGAEADGGGRKAVDDDKELRAILSDYDELTKALEADLSECAAVQVVELRKQEQTPLKELLKQNPQIFERGKHMHWLIKARADLRKIGKLLAVSC